MNLYMGTSGYSYKEWIGKFYPAKTKAADMLRLYAEQLGAVEINNTFYRLPKKEILQSWARQVPDDFRFVIKASRKITHIKRLKDALDETSYLFEIAEVLGEKLGLVFFQLPPFLKKDKPRLGTFIGQLPAAVKVAFEFRHESWFDEDILALLRDQGKGLCLADTDTEVVSDLVATANWGHLRLRRAQYSDDELNAWLTKIAARFTGDVYVFFKHEDAGTGPALAKRMHELHHGR